MQPEIRLSVLCHVLSQLNELNEQDQIEASPEMDIKLQYFDESHTAHVQ